MDIFGKLVLGGLLLGAAGTDFRCRRIPNRLIAVGLVVFLAEVVWLCCLGERAMLAGRLVAGVLAFTLHLIPYGLKSMGAGDVKLALITGLLMGWEDWLGYLQVFCPVAILVSGVVLIASRFARKQYAASVSAQDKTPGGDAASVPASDVAPGCAIVSGSEPDIEPGCDGVQEAGQRKPRTLPLAPVMAAAYFFYYAYIILCK